VISEFSGMMGLTYRQRPESIYEGIRLDEDKKYRSWVEVDLDHFTMNWVEMKRLVGPDVKILQVVKHMVMGQSKYPMSPLKTALSCLASPMPTKACNSVSAALQRLFLF
jgi:hypothetical protein